MKLKSKIWIGLGILILIWNLYWFARIKIMSDYGIVGNVIKFTLGYYVLFAYIIVTLICLLIWRKKT